jgi:hypothetical protein
MNFYTDDSPGLKIQPVSACASRGTRWCRAWGKQGAVRAVGRLRAPGPPGPLLHPAARSIDRLPTPSRGPRRQQVWVIVMSLGFILFVTVLHIIGKLRG